MRCTVGRLHVGAACLLLWLMPLAQAPAPAQEAGARLRGGQFPSPMVEHTRRHPRLERGEPAGRREALSIGSLFVPEALRGRERMPLLIHFHGATWLPEAAAAKQERTAVVAVQLRSGSSVYVRPFEREERFGELIDEARRACGCELEPVVLSAWSAGYGAVRQILRSPHNYETVDAVLLLDALHAGYVNGAPGPGESELEGDDLAVFVQFARDAVAEKKQLIITHTEVFPGTFASTTETSDYVLRQLELARTPVLEWGPMGTQQLSEVRAGKLYVAGYAGNSAPDHVDQLHALPEFLDWIEWPGVEAME